MEEQIGKNIRVLYIDNEQYNLNAFKAYFRNNNNYEIYICHTEKEGLSIIKQVGIDILIIDQQKPDMIGIEFLVEVSERIQPVKIIVTAHRDISTLVEALREGKIFRYYQKPYDIEVLKESITEGYNKMKL